MLGKKSEEEKKLPCSDEPPDGVFTCSRQQKWGKCEEAWMQPFCCYSCHKCNMCQNVDALSIANKLLN